MAARRCWNQSRRSKLRFAAAVLERGSVVKPPSRAFGSSCFIHPVGVNLKLPSLPLPCSTLESPQEIRCFSSQSTAVARQSSRSNGHRNNSNRQRGHSNNRTNNNHQRRRSGRIRQDPDAAAKERDARRTTERILDLGKEVQSSAINEGSSGLSTHAFQKILHERSFWSDADTTLHWWTTTKHKRQHAAQSVTVSFQLLDALADLSSLAQEPQLSGPILRTTTLNKLVQHWLVASMVQQQQQHLSDNTTDTIMTPPEMFQKLEEYRTDSRNTSRTRRNLRPTLETYQILMETVGAFAGTSAPPGFNESIVRHLRKEGTKDPDINPDLKAVAHILHGWSVRGQLVSLDELTGVLDLLEEFIESDDTKQSTEPNLETQPRMVRLFNEALFAMARNNSNSNSKGNDGSVSRGADKMLSILYYMEFLATAYPDEELHPTVETYNLVLNGFARAGKGAQAEMVLQTMVQRYVQAQQKQQGDSDTTTTDDSSSQEIEESEAKTAIVGQEVKKGSHLAVAPEPKSFTIVITAFGNSDEKYAAEKAEGVLRWQQELNEGEGGPLYGLVPLETLTYNNVMRAWSWRRSENGVQKCNDLRKEMQRNHVAPDQQSYGQSLKAIALSNMRDKGRPAVQVWREMEINGLKANDYAQKYFEKCVAIPKPRRRREPRS